MSRICQLSPLNRNWSPNFGAVSRWLVLPDSKSGQTWIDIAARNNGTLTNGATLSTLRPDGGFGSVSFDGTDDFVDLGSGASLNSTGNMTFSCWYKSASSTQNQAFFASSLNGGQANFAVTFGFNDTFFELWNNASGPVITSTTAISDSNWHHYAATRSGTSGSWNLALYIDGKLDKSGTSATDPTGGTYPVSVGRFGAFGGYYLMGQLSDAGLWSRALTQFEVWAMYQDSRQGYQNTLNWKRSRSAGSPSQSVASRLTLLGVG